jgi:hypothetical protein
MYAALQQVAPSQSVGFDIKAEYEVALTLFNKKH